jgi:transcriptional regulator with XRE-family HTH domain
MQLDITLTQLARRAELSAPFLSQVERGESGLSLTSLLRLAEALGVSINYFVAPTVGKAPVRAPEELDYFTLDGSEVRHARLGSMTSDRQLEPLLVVIPPHYESEPFRHAGEEFFYVKQGYLQVRIGSKTYSLGPGYTAHFNSGQRHRWRNDRDEEVHLIWVGTPRLF